MRVAALVAVIVAALCSAGCEQCIIRPCGGCYDAIISAAVKAKDPGRPPREHAPPQPRPAAMTH
jgi:hypothetical protein